MEEEIRLTTVRLDRATVLITSLKDEHIRWTELKSLLKTKVETIAGDSALAAGLVTYLGPFAGTFRGQII